MTRAKISLSPKEKEQLKREYIEELLVKTPVPTEQLKKMKSALEKGST